MAGAMRVCRLLSVQLLLVSYCYWGTVVLGQDDLPTCLDSFDIHQDKIIRTQDSRAMGAKYINERDVSSREDCLRLCCQTQDCDVFVFEEKTPGSCYLFQCGSPEDFKCKFTKHRNYTSAVLVLNRHMTELESQIKHTQHEHELAKLRQPEIEPVAVLSVTVSEAPTTIAPGNKEVIQVEPTTSPIGQSRRCSRYQFECHGSGECIAIYNACDGIPQCTDGSDEAPELGCPAQASTIPPAPKVVEQPQPPAALPPSSDRQSYQRGNQGAPPPVPPAETGPEAMPSVKQYHSNQWTPQIFESQQHLSPNPVSGYMQPSAPLMQQPPQPALQQQQQPAAEFPQSPPQLVQQAKQFGREGEGLLFRPQSELLQWPTYQQDQQLLNYRNGGSQIFSHKGSGLVAQSDRYRHVHGNKVVGEGGQFEPIQQDYNHYNNYFESGPYHKTPQAPNGWQPLHKPHDLNSMSGVEENMNVPVAPNSLPGPDYYYEESFHSRLQPQTQLGAQPPQQHLNLQPSPEAAKMKLAVPKGEVEMETQQAAAESERESKAAEANTNSSVKKAAVHHEPTINTTDKPKEAHHHAEHHHNLHRRVESLSAELSLTENSFDSDDNQSVNPRGAILSLTMGLCVTGIMLVLVGCRMRMVRRRMRRGSKSPYAHDADFLVNGMYL